ncbi:MAG: ribonuclease HII [Candidatus Hydrogenedentes bacterium]|nr:ribonuclease HII [Candidatus Hydrogenedentota bacterium]
MSAHSPCDWLAVAPDPAFESMTLFERQVARGGSRSIAGVDEAGRGPLAGPIVAAAVILGEPVPGVDDSKRLTQARREEWYEILMSGPHTVSAEVVDHDTIDTHGIQTANYMAMARALEGLDPPADFALVDGFTIRGCRTPQLRIVKGDRRSQSIAAASIIAKVTRDRIMRELDSEFPEYGFARHKGYATRDHLIALETHGPCRVHRRSFSPIAATVETLQLFQDTG